MSGIRGKNTKPELLIRSHLHAEGFRYRIHDKKLAGKPDLVFPKWNAVLFVHGCFWHRHECNLFKLPKSRTTSWDKKLEANRRRDLRHVEELISSGFRVGVVWECAIKGKHKIPVDHIIEKVSNWLQSNELKLEVAGTR